MSARFRESKPALILDERRLRAGCMRWAEFRGPGLANRLQTAIFGDSSGICKTRIQQQQTVAAEFGTFLLKTAMAHMEIRNRDEKTAVGMNLRSHSLDKLRLRQIVTTGALLRSRSSSSRQPGRSWRPAVDAAAKAMLRLKAAAKRRPSLDSACRERPQHAGSPASHSPPAPIAGKHAAQQQRYGCT
jgi:hypothetical protein